MVQVNRSKHRTTLPVMPILRFNAAAVRHSLGQPCRAEDMIRLTVNPGTGYDSSLYSTLTISST